ncbi:MAG TPA: hypothetical protein VF812_04100 [Ktedonobacterales bacterium]
MRSVSSVTVWGLGLIAELLLIYDVLLINMQARDWFTGCTVGPGADIYPCTPLLPPLLVTVPTSGPIFLNGLLALLLALFVGLPAWILGPTLARRRGASARVALLITSLPATACAVGALVSLFARYPVLSATETCFWQPQISGQLAADPACMYGDQATMFAILGVAFQPLLAACVLTIPAWVMGLTETDRHQRWRWYFGVLFFSPFAATLYGLCGRHLQPAKPASAPAPADDPLSY